MQFQGVDVSIIFISILGIKFRSCKKTFVNIVYRRYFKFVQLK